MTTPKGAAPSEPASFWEELLDLLEQVMGIPSMLLSKFFSVNWFGGLFRLVLFLLIGLASWVALAVIRHPLTFDWAGYKEAFFQAVFFFLDPDLVVALLIGTIKVVFYTYILCTEVIVRMFSADIFRHVLAAVIPAIMAVHIATQYLSDIFELEAAGIAFRFIMRAAFGVIWHRINIKEGEVAQEDLDSPILRIGGPGRVRVNLENVAVFERITGETHLIGPTVKRRNKMDFLQSFERLREVIDLRDQFPKLSEVQILDGRTRDGIRIFARDIKYSFSVLRADPGSSPDPKNPLSYSEAGLKRLVYERGRGPVRDEMWTMIRLELRNFIASLTLSEFLAQAVLPDAVPNQGESIIFHSRPELTQRFYGEAFRLKATRSGLQLHMIDVGTWMAPAAMIPAKYLEAWKINIENQIREQNIALLARETRLEEMLRLVREVPLISYRRSRAQGKLDEDIRLEVITDYLGTLRAAQAVMPIQEYPVERPQLDAAINYLGDYIRRHSTRAGRVRFLEPPAD
jgi:hypothetical protein